MANSTVQYVGARYVPKFADPVEWQSNTYYEALTIVTYNNSSYTSKIPVPATVGNPAENGTYWALTGNYNSQVEQYRRESEETKQQVEKCEKEVENIKNEQKTLDSKIEQEISDRTALIYDNNGKADIPKSLSIEGMLNANDGAEISGSLQYGIPEFKNNNKVVGLISTSGEKYDLLTSENAEAHHLVFGDSWVSLDEVDTYPERTNWYRSLLNYFPNIHSFAVRGSVFADLTTQIEKAKNDTSFVNSSVKTIIIVCGVNDYRNNINASTAAENLNKVLLDINSAFPNASVTTFIDTFSPFTMYFSYSYGFRDNWNYAKEIANQAKCATYPLSPYLLLQRYFEKSGTSSFHLNAQGSAVLEKLFANVINGMPPSFSVRVSNTERIKLTKATSSGDETTETDALVIVDIYNEGSFCRYGFYIPINATSANNSCKIEFIISDETDYGYLVPPDISFWENKISGHYGGFMYYNMTGKVLEMYSSNNTFDPFLYTSLHAG